jgi:hypothetical protein
LIHQLAACQAVLCGPTLLCAGEDHIDHLEGGSACLQARHQPRCRGLLISGSIGLVSVPVQPRAAWRRAHIPPPCCMRAIWSVR